MPGMDEEKRMRIQWAKNFEPEALSSYDVDTEPSGEWDGGDCWEDGDE